MGDGINFFNPESPDAGGASSEQEREAFAALMKTVMPDRVLMTIEYFYDERGRVTFRTMQMGVMNEERHTYRYNDRDDVVEEHVQQRSREFGIRGDRVIAREESLRESWTRNEYRYDERGNWTERILFQRLSPEEDFRRTSIERRNIGYFD